MNVRELRHEDLAQISWAGSPLHLRNVAAELDRALLREVDYLAVESDIGVVSIGGLDAVKRAPVGWIWQLSTHPMFRSQGYGTALVEALEDRARQRNMSAVELSVEDDNPRARSLYQRLGYAVVEPIEESWLEEDAEGNIATHFATGALMRKNLLA